LPRDRRLGLLRAFCSRPEIGGLPKGYESLLDNPERVRDWMVQLTIDCSRSRGRVLRGGECVIPNDRKPGDVEIDAGNVKAAWRSLDAQTRRKLQNLKAQSGERDAGCREQANDRAYRLGLAVEDAIKADLPSGQKSATHARRAVLLGCLLACPGELPLPGEFGSWRWESTGNLLDELDRKLGRTAGEAYIPGRGTVLFDPAWRPGDNNSPVTERFDVMKFTALVRRAVSECGVVRTDATAQAPDTPSGPRRSRPTVDDDQEPGEPKATRLDNDQEPSLTPNQSLVLRMMARYVVSELASVAGILGQMQPKERLSERTVGDAVRHLIKLGLAERPQGERLGARLTREGRTLAENISD
jgi:hypothetical protein